MKSYYWGHAGAVTVMQVIHDLCMRVCVYVQCSCMNIEYFWLQIDACRSVFQFISTHSFQSIIYYKSRTLWASSSIVIVY